MSAHNMTSQYVFFWQVDNDDMVATLESIVEKFGEEMAPYAVGLMQHLAIAFWRILDADDKVSSNAVLAAPGSYQSINQQSAHDSKLRV